MDIEPTSSVSTLMRDAKRRVDGLAMYIAMGILFLGAVAKAVVNLSVGDMSFIAWKVVIASCLMIPITMLLYFVLSVFSTKGSSVSRWFNAVCLISVPLYLYIKLL